MQSRFRVAGQGPTERIVIEMMRSAAAGGAADAGFAALVREARLAGMRILPSRAPFLTGDEVRLIGWVAYRQREWEVSLPLAPDAIDAAAERCAEALKARRLRLPFLSVQRLAFVAGGATGAEDPALAPPAAAPAPRAGSLRAAAVSLARQRTNVHARELKRAGISRQYLSRLCKAGVLIRTGYGFYRAP